MKLLLSALAIVGMLLVGGTVVAPAFASPPICTIFSHPAGCVLPTPIFANAGGDGAISCTVRNVCPSSSAP